MCGWSAKAEEKAVTLNGTEKPEITYPCAWQYKLIGRDTDAIHQLIRETLGGKDFKAKEGNRSRSGKFTTINVEVLVMNEDERLYFFETFRAHEAVLHLL